MAPGTSRHCPLHARLERVAAEPYAELVMLRDATGDDASNDVALAAWSRDVSTTSLNRLGLIGPKGDQCGAGDMPVTLIRLHRQRRS
jgi:hypothetical protein